MKTPHVVKPVCEGRRWNGQDLDMPSRFYSPCTTTRHTERPFRPCHDVCCDLQAAQGKQESSPALNGKPAVVLNGEDDADIVF